mmetsp:Transcript_492/g.636  ORF Transcript_492/g.636 Transcript_492/m.636 type:complete len:536 (-) Transcript_492:1210-2817(-)|eukprot:CAMPEP_0197299908 /NCGR_PEP_ID=MMETSP0890-20130614/47070_1 /TAXON_ID=44058 ORGANISM="Aureoumbra lagunensis, Strain CCMP1510" /NCGR_SAMPLE_ID=MMETSP0890 /ASSEMBLY_ACC=CAM_ASM_000533 /LENGTH=535 /DNA_ID=CAMNT_0042778457 /DNA_START=84 /DNA_END=1691 /DNA_ORIENTATION=+
MLRAPSHDELQREAIYVQEVLRVSKESPIGQTLVALDIPDTWSTPSLKHALQYCFRMCYDPGLWTRIHTDTAKAILPNANLQESHPSEALLAFDLQAGVMAVRLQKPAPPVIPTAFRVPGTQLGLLAARYLIWKTKASCPDTDDPYQATSTFIRALQFQDTTKLVGSHYPRYHVFLAIIVNLVHKALQRMSTPQMYPSMKQMQQMSEVSENQSNQQGSQAMGNLAPVMDSEPAATLRTGPIILLRLPDFKMIITIQNKESSLEVRSILQSKSFSPTTTFYIENYVPAGLVLAGRTGEGNLKPFRLGIDMEAWATPPAEIQPLVLRVSVFIQGVFESKMLVNRSFVAKYSNDMDVWPTVTDPYRIHSLAKKMQDHIHSALVYATKGKLNEGQDSCSIFVSTSALNSKSRQTDPKLGSIAYQIMFDLLHLAKTDLDFDGRFLVNVYVPKDVFGTESPPTPEINYVSDGSIQVKKRVRNDTDRGDVECKEENVVCSSGASNPTSDDVSLYYESQSHSRIDALRISTEFDFDELIGLGY